MASSNRPRWAADVAAAERVLVALEGVGHARFLAGQELDEERLLDVEPVLGLVEDQAPRPVHDLGRDLLAAMGRQAVHRQCVGPRGIEHGVVHLVAAEGVAALLRLGLLAHRGPGVGVDDVGAADHRVWIGPEGEPPAGGLGQLRRASHDALVGAVAVGVGEADLHAHGRADERERVVDVVAVADEREDHPLEAGQALLDREQVGQRLAGMLAQGQAVDHRDRRPARRARRRPRAGRSGPRSRRRTARGCGRRRGRSRGRPGPRRWSGRWRARRAGPSPSRT